MNSFLKLKWTKSFRLFILWSVVISFFAGINWVSPSGYLFRVKRDLLLQWYPNWGYVIFYILKIFQFVQLITIIGVVLFCLLFIVDITLKKRKEFLLLICSVIFSLIMAESILRLYGCHPGFYIQSFRPLNKLSDVKGLIADENGLTKIDTSFAVSIASFSRQPNKYLKQVFSDFKSAADGKVHNDFSRYYQQLKTESEKKLTALDSAILTYANRPINADGFRSISFKNHQGRVRILLLGDSFTWGLRARNITSSFADIILAHGYEVYNTGISGADPPQYLAAAKRFVPLLKPDIVIVNFCLTNDVQYFYRSPRPYTPFMFLTNAGGLEAAPYGTYWSNSLEARNFLRDFCRIPQTSFFNKLCSRTCITTFIWKLLAVHYQWEMHSPLVQAYMRKAKTQLYEVPPVNAQMDSIQKICDENNATMVLSTIPACINGEPLKYVKDYKNLFPVEIYFTPYSITPSDYEYRDFHFNDSGHLKYAQFLMHIIDSISESKCNLP